MDHVYNSIADFYDVYFDSFMDEHRTGKYKKLCDNPWYDELKTIIDAMNVIRKYLDWGTIKLSEEVKRSK